MANVFGKTLSGSRSLDVDDLTIGTVSITQRYSTVPYSITLPQTQGSASMILVNDGSGNLTWAYPSVSPPITGVLPVLNGGTGVTQSTGTEKVVLFRSPTFADDITVPTIKGGGIDGSLDITSGLNTSAILSIQSSNIIGLTAPAIYLGETRFPSLKGPINTYLKTTDTIGTTSWDIVTLEDVTGVAIGGAGTILTSTGTGVVWNPPTQVGIMYYKQTEFPYTPGNFPGRQSWPGWTIGGGPGKIDLRTLYPVAGSQIGLALTYGYGDAGFGRFTNPYSFPLIATVSYSAAKYVDLVSVSEGFQYDGIVNAIIWGVNGATGFWIEKNDDGLRVGSSAGTSTEVCTGEAILVLQPGDFFQVRGLTTGISIGSLINNQTEVYVYLNTLNQTPTIAPSTPGSGTVTAVNIAAADTFFAVGGGPITTSGTLTIGLSGEALPTTVGGTGLTTVGTTGKVLQSDGANIAWSNITGTGAVTLSTAPTFTTEITTPAIRGAVNLDITAANFSNIASGNSFNTCVGIYTQLSDNYAFFGSKGYLDIRSGFEGEDSIYMSSTQDIHLSATRNILIGGNIYPKTAGTNGYVLTTNGAGATSWQPAPGAGGGGGTGTVLSVGLTSSAAFITVTGATITTSGFFDLNIGTLGTANGGTGSTGASTGTGGVVLRTSPTFTTSLSTPRVTGSGTSGNLTITSADIINLENDGWIYLNSNWNLGSAPVGSIRGFAFGWNNSGEEGESIMTYYTGAGSSPRLDICSWDGATRTPRLTINSVGDLIIKRRIKADPTSLLGDLDMSAPRDVTITATRFLDLLNTGVTTMTGSSIYANQRRLDMTNYATYGGASPLPNAANTSYKPSLGLVQSLGTVLAYDSSNGDFTNNTGREIFITVSYSCRRDSNGFGYTQMGIELNGSGVQIGTTSAAPSGSFPPFWQSGTCDFRLPNGEFFRLVGYQNSGTGNDFNVDSRLFYKYDKF